MSKKAKLWAYLLALELGNNLDSFSDRIRIQKVVYLLKQYDPDMQFGYSWYIHGPYSPELTRLLFEDDEGKPARLREENLATINEIRNFLMEDLYSPDHLELIVSLLYLNKNGEALGLKTRDEIEGFLMQEKPQFSDEEVAAAWGKIENSPKFKKLLVAE